MKMKTVKADKRGFSLTEVIVSIAIVSIVVLAVSSTFLSVRRIERQCRKRKPCQRNKKYLQHFLQ
jgi:prepilin-type N-terminal cleavage/methylation domain-containing protein